MRVLLIHPPVRDFYATPLRREPLGLLYVAAALRRAGHDVGLLDCGAPSKARRVEPPRALRACVPASDGNDCSPFKLFGRFYHFGLGKEEIEERIRDFAPAAVGISALFNAYAEEAISCAEAALRAAPAAVRILGGGYPSSAPRSALRHPAHGSASRWSCVTSAAE